MPEKVTIGMILLVAAVFFAGASCAGDRLPTETEVLLTGALNQSNQFVDEAGETYDLAINERTAELLDMPRQVIEIKGTLMELDGKKTLSITDIRPVNP